MGFTSTSCTDEPCKWNNTFCSGVQATKVADIKFYKEEAKNKLNVKLGNTFPLATEQDQQELLDMLASSSGSSVGLSLFSEYSNSFVPTKSKVSDIKYPDSLRKLYKHDYESMSVNDLRQVPIDMHVKLSGETIDLVEVGTRKQSSSPVWFEVREGRITSSTAFDVLHTSDLYPAKSLIKKICNKSNTSTGKKPAALSWGANHEQYAFSLYQKHVTGQRSSKEKYLGPDNTIHKNCHVSKCGFHIDKENQCLGASPDGIISCECCGKGSLEIKCPMSCKEKSLLDKILDASFYLDQNLKLKENHRYFAQVQVQMHVLNVQFVDFVVWTPNEYVITRVKRDQNFLSAAIPQLILFWKQHVVPELLGRHLEHQQTTAATVANVTDAALINSVDETSCSDTTSNTEYCICKTTTKLYKMVGCDSCNNWFHLACINLKRYPRSKTWYCKDCRKAKKACKN